MHFFLGILRVKCDILAYLKSEAPLVEPSEESKLWIIAAVAGPILLILVIIWIVLCIYIKCFRTTKEPLEENSPQLTNLTRTTTKKVRPRVHCKDKVMK